MESAPKGFFNSAKAHNFADLPEAVLDTLVRFAGELPTAQSDILISHLGGAISDIAPDATPYEHRSAQFVVTPGARWEGGESNDAAVTWVRDCWDAVEEQAAGGSYVNFIAERSGREQDAFGSNHQQLVELKRRFDPHKLFRMNQNISPDGAGPRNIAAQHPFSEGRTG